MISNPNILSAAFACRNSKKESHLFAFRALMFFTQMKFLAGCINILTVPFAEKKTNKFLFEKKIP